MSVSNDILDGKHDDELDAIIAAVDGRRKGLASLMVAGINPGDTVQFTDNIRPKYLIGKTATVVRVNRASVVIDFPSDPTTYGRLAGSKDVRCPNTLIKKI